MQLTPLALNSMSGENRMKNTKNISFIFDVKIFSKQSLYVGSGWWSLQSRDDAWPQLLPIQKIVNNNIFLESFRSEINSYRDTPNIYLQQVND